MKTNVNNNAMEKRNTMTKKPRAQCFAICYYRKSHEHIKTWDAVWKLTYQVLLKNKLLKRTEHNHISSIQCHETKESS